MTTRRTMTMCVHILRLRAAHGHRGLARVEVATILAAIVMAAAVVLPVGARLRGLSGVDGSLDNLAQLGLAHAVYAADWNGRQATVIVDEFAVYGTTPLQAVANYESLFGEPHPPVIFGWSSVGGPDDPFLAIWGYWFDISSGNLLLPIGFSGTFTGFGSFRFPNTRPLHEYVDGRFYSPAWYAPNDEVPHGLASWSFDQQDEFDADGLTGAFPAWSSYCLSPAAMYGREVLRAPSLGGWRNPMEIPLGLASPPLNAALYPHLKTHMLEHHWVQSPPGLCNLPLESGSYLGCEPYYFNHGIASTPATLFYDGHVRLLPNEEVQASDQQVMTQSGGVDGLWSRDTPLGADGYFLEFAHDDVVDVSHHVLTTGGIWGRDTLGPGVTTSKAKAASGNHRITARRKVPHHRYRLERRRWEP